MEDHPLLQTKLYIPPGRPELVSRPRLIERLNAGLPTRDASARALTLISAPAGFGKTTLVSDWAHKAGAYPDAPQIAWLSLGEGDNDPTRFLAYVIAALQTVGTRQESAAQQEPVGNRREPVGLIGKGMLSALQSPQPLPAEAVLTSLINEIAARPDRIILVLDDYHLIDAQPIHDALTFLLEHLPPQMHLVIVTREDPLLPLARLRARGQLTELRATDLRFTPSEAAEFLNQAMGLDLSAADIAALEIRTEGWIAGLQLAALALQGLAQQGLVLQGTLSIQDRKDASSLIRSFAGSHRFVLDYLVEEVLHQQSDNVQTFLLQTAVLDRMTGSLCDAVRFGAAQAPSTPGASAVRFDPARSPTSQAILETLDRASLFIVPLDEERRWYRYHHLFADLLRQRLRQTQSEQVPILHHRASEWYEQNGFVEQAIEHALQAEDYERTAQLIEEQVDAIWMRSEHAKLRRWLARLPGELILSKPQLCVFHAWHLFVNGQRDAAERSLQVAEQALELCADGVAETSPLDQQDRMSDTDRTRLQGRASVMRAFIASYLGDVPAIIHHARQALEYLPEQDLAWRSNAAIALGDAQGFKGNMAAAYRARLEAAEASAAQGNTNFSILAYLKVAITLREQGQLQRTMEICQQQMQLAGTSGLSRGSAAGGSLAIWGEVLAELGDLEEALDLTRRGMELAERSGETAMLGWSCMCLIRVLFSMGDTAGAEEIVQKMENTARESSVPPWIANQMAAWQARLWLAQDKLEVASQWMRERALLIAGESEPLHELDYFTLIEYVVLARILIAQEQLDEVTKLLPRLLEAAEAGDRVTTVIEILNLQALAFQAGGNISQAMTALEQSLALAEPGGFFRIFVDEGPPMARLLYQAAGRGIMPDYTAKLLAAFGDGTTDKGRQMIMAAPGPSPVVDDLSSVVHGPPSALVEPLSEREIQVLQLIAKGLTNQEIASRLFLSLNTVKAHTRNIYGKLDVHSRTQAIARSQELGILPRTQV